MNIFIPLTLVVITGVPKRSDSDIAPANSSPRCGITNKLASLRNLVYSASSFLLLLSKYGYVLHIDFDLHHGNGTQDILYRNPHVVHIDIHQDPRTIYPGTGFPWDCGEEDALGTKVNILMPPGSGDDAYDIVIDWIFKYIDATNFRPKYLVYSAGFDAYDGDGLGFIKISSSTYHKLAYKLVNELDIDGVIVVLEGGYNIGLERGAPAFIAGLLSLDDPVKDDVRECSEAVKSRIRRMLREVEEYVLVRKF